MKQTNNAIKFLMAQYRAIFKNANIAMVAAMVASALAAGQAQAAAGDQFEPNALGETQLTDSSIGSGESVEHDASSFGTLKAPSSAAIKIENGGSLSLTAADAQHKGHIFTGNDLIVNSGGSITLSGTTGDKADVAGLVGVAKDIKGNTYTEPTASLSINKGGSLTITSSFALMKDVNVNGTVEISGSTGKSGDDADKNATLKYSALMADTGSLTVGKDAEVTLGAASQLYGRDVVINDGTINFEGTTAAGKDAAANAGALLRAGDDKNGGSLTINGGTLSVAASKFGDIVGTTINMTGGELKVDGTLGLRNNYHDGAKTARMTVTGDATITGSGTFNLANKAVLTVDKAILDNFVKDNSTGGKFTFSGPSTQITIKSDKAVDLSKYTYGNGAGADFDVTKDSVVGKIKGEKLSITKATAGTLTNTTSTGINVDANILSLGSANTDSKLSALQGSVFKYLIARDKLTLAGSGDKFTVDKGDLLLTNNQPEVSVIDGATINFEKGRFLIQGAWSSDSDITLTGADGTTGGNIIVGQSNAKTDSSLALTGTIKNDKAANTWGGITTDGASTYKNTVDLTKAKFASTGTAGNLVSLHARNNGTIKLTGAQASDILAAKDNTKGFAISVESGGTIEVQGELKADFSDFIEFNATGSVAANKFVIGASGSNGATNLGGTLIADKINIAASGDTLNLNKASIKSADITLGNGTLKSGAVVATSKLNIGEFTLGDSGAFALEGKGTVSGTTLTVKGTGASLDVDGSWTLNSGLATTAGSGTVTIDNESMLSVTGALDVADNTVKVNNGSTFKADYSKANATDKKLGKVDVDATSHLELTNYDKASISLDDLKAQKEKFLGQNVSGLFGITGKNGAAVSVTGTKAENGKVSYTDAQGAANLDGIYAGVTVTGVNGDVTSTNDWGAVQLADGTSSLAIGSSNTAGSVHLNGAAGSNVLVADKDGNAANVTLNNAASVLIINKSGEIKDITAGAANNGNVVVMDNAQLTAGDIGAGTAVGSVDVLGNLVAKNVNAQSITVDGTVSNAKSLTAKEFEIFGNVNADAVTLNASGTMTVKSAAVDAGTMNVGESGSMTVTAGAVVTADTLNGATNAVINVGQDGVENGTASLFAGTLNLKSGTLFVDPEYGEHYAAVTVTNFSSKGTTQTDDKSAGLVDGKINVGKNAALGVGFESKAELDAVLANYVNADGSFYKSSSNGLANALVLNKAITLSDQDGIYVAADATASSAQANKVTINDGAGLIITDNVFKTDDAGKKSGTAISVNNGATIDVTGAQLKLIGNFTGADKGLQIFSDTTTAISGTMTIKSANGLLNGELDANTGKMDLNFDRDAAVNAGAFADASEPVRNMLLDQLDGKLAYSKAIGYQLIADAATASLSGAVVDAAAHAATYAGAQQAAVLSVTTMADAMFGRVGAVGVEAASIAATGSQANGGVWLTPMYKSMDSDGFNAQGASYGSDVDAAGVAFGADTVNGNMRFGAVFNIGSGDAEGKGNGNGLKDEFDYYGFGIYSAMGFGNFALVGDASLTVISHDVEGLGLKGKADTTAVTMGVTGQYTVATPSVDVTPHLGARFIRLNTDSYDLISAKGVEATTDFDVQNVFSIPLGVTLSKGFVTGGWTLAPSADLSVTFNTGDTDAKSTTTFTGVKALNLNTEVLDEVQYGVTLGLGAQNGAFGTSFGINYTGSSNTDSFGVNAQCRYMF